MLNKQIYKKSSILRSMLQKKGKHKTKLNNLESSENKNQVKMEKQTKKKEDLQNKTNLIQK